MTLHEYERSGPWFGNYTPKRGKLLSKGARIFLWLCVLAVVVRTLIGLNWSFK